MGPNSAPKPDEAKPKMPGEVPTNRLKPSPIDFDPVSGCFNHDPKLLNCEIAQPRNPGILKNHSLHGTDKEKFNRQRHRHKNTDPTIRPGG